MLLLSVTITIKAQETANLIQVKGKDVYAVLLNNVEFKSVGNVDLTDGQINTATNLEERIKLFIKNSTAKYDALMTRNGNTAMLMQYVDKSKSPKGKVVKNLDKEIYFLSTPTKKYSVVGQKELSIEEVRLPFSQIINDAISNVDKQFDAVIIKSNVVEYIVFK